MGKGKTKGKQTDLGLKIEETELGKKAKELIGIQDDFSATQESMSEKKEEVMELMKAEKKTEIHIEGKRIFIKHTDDSISIKSDKDSGI